MEFNSQTAVAIARLIITIIAAVASTFGWLFDSELWLNIVLSAFALAVLAWTWWKNNNITHAAQEAQKVLDEMKHGEEIKIGGSE